MKKELVFKKTRRNASIPVFTLGKSVNNVFYTSNMRMNKSHQASIRL